MRNKALVIIIRCILFLLGLTGALLFLNTMLRHIFNIGNAAGLLASFLLLILAIWFPGISAFLKTLWTHKAGKIFLSIAGGLFAAGAALCVVLSVFMAHAMHKEPEQPQAILVLGCKVNGSSPSLMLSRRIRTAYSAMQDYPEIPVVVSGGQGKDEDIPEAECMKRELLKLGIAEERILCEEQSTTTSENLRFSNEILAEKGISGEIAIVTDGFHQFRAQRLAKKQGISDCSAVPAPTSWYLLPTYWIREWFGIAHLLVFGS